MFLILLVCFLIFIEIISTAADRGGCLGVDNASRIAFINDLGVVVNSEFTEEKQIVIPNKFNEVYLKYNEIQKQAGFDLLEFAGKNAVVYKYKAESFNGSDSVFVNLIVLDGEIIGGDISSVEFDGFMLPLMNVNENQIR